MLVLVLAYSMKLRYQRSTYLGEVRPLENGADRDEWSTPVLVSYIHND